MKKILILLVVCAVLLASITAVKNDNAIIIYSCMEQFRNDALQAQLDEAFPELDIFVMYMPTAKAAAKLSIEGETTDADVIVALEYAYMQKVESHMAEVAQYSEQEYLPDVRPESKKYIIWERPACSLIVNRDILEKHGVPVPESYEDLLDPMYKNLIAMPDPKSSGTGYSFLLNLCNVWGEEAAFSYFDRLAPNVKQFTESGLGPVKLLIQGEIGIGFGLTPQAVDEINKGHDFLIVEPEFGSPYSLTCTSMVKGRENDPDIQRVFRFIANEYMVYDKMYGSPGKVLVHQENGVANYPQDITFADMTGINDLAEKERLLEKWKY